MESAEAAESHRKSSREYQRRRAEHIEDLEEKVASLTAENGRLQIENIDLKVQQLFYESFRRVEGGKDGRNCSTKLMTAAPRCRTRATLATDA